LNWYTKEQFLLLGGGIYENEKNFI